MGLASPQIHGWWWGEGAGCPSGGRGRTGEGVGAKNSPVLCGWGIGKMRP